MLNRRNSSSFEPILTGTNRFFEKTSTPVPRVLPSKAVITATNIEDFIQPATEVFRLYQSWSPEYIGFCPPSMVCIITGPAAIMLRFARHLRKEQNGRENEPSIQEDLLILVLSHFARYWNIGLLLLGLSPFFSKSLS
jgi:hypothetical protein